MPYEPDYKLGKTYGRKGNVSRTGQTPPRVTDIELPPRKQKREVPAPGYAISPQYIKVGNRVKKLGRS